MSIILKLRRNEFSIKSTRRFYLFIFVSGTAYLICFLYFLPTLQESNNSIDKNNLSLNSSLSFLGKLSHILNRVFASKSVDKVENKYKNYFLNAARLQEMGLVVNTSHCKIIDFSPWDQDVKHLITKAVPLEDCQKTNYNWSHIENDVLVMNTQTMEEDGYSLENEFCCYKIIKRYNTPQISLNMKADNSISYSDCIQILKDRTKISAEFIMVQCSWSRFIYAVHYRGFHGVATSNENRRAPLIKSKVNFWNQEKSNSLLPPNILILGIDSTSRINFRRNMLETKKMLETLGAVEMFGYLKVGENTFPNYCPMFSGYSQEELMNICGPDDKYFDDCPMIWKELDIANYLTAHTEDAPDFGGFNYIKPGFMDQPVDFYVRPLFLAAHEYGSPYLLNLVKNDHLDCISYQTNDEAITTYVESTMDFAHKNKAPIFSFSWSTTLPHDNPNMIQLADDTYSQLLKNLLAKGQLNNTILIFMGDHGYRFGKIRETLVGYYEDKLPNLWIYLPPTVKEMYPEWAEALEINSRIPTTPFHFYWTIRQILQTFTKIQSKSNQEIIFTRNYTDQNFLQKVLEENSCSDLGVPDRYCPCYTLQAVSLVDSFLVQGAETAVQKINRDLNPDLSQRMNHCATLKLSKITAGAFIDKSSSSTSIKKYIVAFLTEPGEFLIEAEIDYFNENGTFSEMPNVQRASKINQKHVRCIKDSKIELFCYCER